MKPKNQKRLDSLIKIKKLLDSNLKKGLKNGKLPESLTKTLLKNNQTECKILEMVLNDEKKMIKSPV